MLRAILMVPLLAGAAEAFATGFDHDLCPTSRLSRSEYRQLDAQVRAATGLRLADRDPYTCRRGGSVTVYGSTRRSIEKEGTELWYEAQCEFNREFSPVWDCKHIPMRIVRVRDHWRDGDGEVYIPLKSDGVLVQRRLNEAWALAATLGEQHACEPKPSAAQQILEVRSDLAYYFNHFEVAMENERFTLWTTRYAIQFTADATEGGLHLRCWRPRKSPTECLISRCPA